MTPYYDDGTCVIYHGDCREIQAWTAADVVVTDPPYGIAWKKGLNRAAGSRAHEGITNDTDTTARDWRSPNVAKSRLLWRMIHEGLPPTRTKPQIELGGPAWWLLPGGDPFANESSAVVSPPPSDAPPPEYEQVGWLNPMHSFIDKEFTDREWTEYNYRHDESDGWEPVFRRVRDEAPNEK